MCRARYCSYKIQWRILENHGERKYSYEIFSPYWRNCKRFLWSQHFLSAVYQQKENQISPESAGSFIERLRSSLIQFYRQKFSGFLTKELSFFFHYKLSSVIIFFSFSLQKTLKVLLAHIVALLICKYIPTFHYPMNNDPTFHCKLLQDEAY